MLQTFFYAMSGGACTECINEKGFSPAGASVRELVWTLRRYLSALARWGKYAVWPCPIVFSDRGREMRDSCPLVVSPPWRAVLVLGSDLLLIDGSESGSESESEPEST